MTEHEELALYKKALVDWEKPIEDAEETETAKGFCWYFEYKALGYFYHSFEKSLPFLFIQRKTADNEDFHYRRNGKHPEGRQQRVTALKNAIEILENKLK